MAKNLISKCQDITLVALTSESCTNNVAAILPARFTTVFMFTSFALRLNLLLDKFERL